MCEKCKEMQLEIERLRGLFQIDGEQHANHVRELEARHEVRHRAYCAEIERLRADNEFLRKTMRNAIASQDWTEARRALGGTSDEQTPN